MSDNDDGPEESDSEDIEIAVAADLIQVMARPQVSENGEALDDGALITNIELKLEADTVEELTRCLADDLDDDHDGSVTVYFPLTSGEAVEFAAEVMTSANGGDAVVNGSVANGFALGLDMANSPEGIEAAVDRYLTVARQASVGRSKDEFVSDLREAVRSTVNLVTTLSHRIDLIEKEAGDGIRNGG